jgi:hypothetical protein
MMRAQTFPIAQVERAIVPLANSLIAAFDSPAALGHLRSSLLAAGISIERLELHSSADSIRRPGSNDARNGMVATLRHWARQVTSAGGLSPAHEREYREGRMLVIVRDTARSEGRSLGRILAEFGGRTIQHYGRFSVAQFSG